ncbi:MAG: DUF4405 domain-containing protein [Clostridia bacterium]|nr:DUF4405 domain-containing protein [Clostridia bacterium]
MTVAMLMLYKKNSISIMFHEIVGLAAIGIMLVHLSVNFLWVKGITINLFRKKLPAKTLISYIINALMFIDLIVLLISSILISKKLFHFQAAMVWKPIHFFTSQLLITLMGLHLGLHFTYIGNVLSVKKSKAGKIIFISVFSVIAVFGVLSMKSSGYAKQISMPVTMMTNKNQGGMKRPPKEMMRQTGEKKLMEGHGEGRGQGMGNGSGKGEVHQGMGKGNMKGSGKGAVKSPKTFFVSVGQTAAIMIFYAMISFLISELVKVIKSKKEK